MASDGFAGDFLSHFTTVTTQERTACAVAAQTRRPSLVDDVRHCDIFAGTPGLKVMLAAGSRSVYSYSLLAATGDLLGVLSFHARRPVPRQTNAAAVARSAAHALAIVT